MQLTAYYSRQLGRRIRAVRTSLGLTQADLAGPHFSKSFISQLERGTVSPSLDALVALASRLNLAAGDLLSPSPEPTPAERLDLVEALIAAGALAEARRHMAAWDPSQLSAPLRLRFLRLRAELAAAEEPDSAEELFTRALADEPAQIEAGWERIRLLASLGDFQAARRAYLKAVRAYEQALQLLDKWWPQAGQVEGAEAPVPPWILSWSDQAALLAHILSALARLYRLLNDPEGAARYEARLGSLAPQGDSLPAILRWLALSAHRLAESGDLESALVEARLAVALARLMHAGSAAGAAAGAGLRGSG